MPSLDGTQGFASQLWNSLTDGGVWGIPRCGLVYVKEAQEKRLVLIQRMPWEEGMPLFPEELRSHQDWDHERVVAMMNAIGVEVIEDAEPLP